MGLGAGRLLLIGATALLVSFGLTPLWQHFAARLGVLAHPGPRRIHRVPTPTAGGVVVFVSFWSALLVHGAFDVFGLYGTPLLIGSLAVVTLGLVDDLLDLRPVVKLIGQIAAAGVLVAGAAGGDLLSFPPFPASALWGGLFAVGWIVAMTNIFNIIDGLDGLASGLAVISSCGLLALAAWQGQGEAALAAAALIGAAIGFLRYNVNPARLFLGDAGGMFLGFVLGFASLQGVLGGPRPIPLAVPLLVVGVPLLDTFFAIVRRAGDGQPIARGDAKHIHHQLVRNGVAAPRAVWLLYSVAGLLAAAAFAAARSAPWHGWAALTLFAVFAWPWARKLGVLGEFRAWAGKGDAKTQSEAPIPRLVPSETVDFHEETGKFQGIAK